MSHAPTVLYPLTLPGLIDYVLTSQSTIYSTTIIICSSRDAFLENLSCSLQDGQAEDESISLHRWLVPTLHNLLTSRCVRLAFCASVQTLLAYLTAYGRSGAEHVDTAGEERAQRIFLVNVLALHASSSAFSAQGLSRTFALAMETSLRARAETCIVECERSIESSPARDGSPEIVDGTEEEPQQQPIADPWEQEVSILNVSARRFGSGQGERAWAGRTVKARRIAGKWFRFHKIEKDAQEGVSPNASSQG